jgi:hypothetical protein
MTPLLPTGHACYLTLPSPEWPSAAFGRNPNSRFQIPETPVRPSARTENLCTSRRKVAIAVQIPRWRFPSNSRVEKAPPSLKPGLEGPSFVSTLIRSVAVVNLKDVFLRHRVQPPHRAPGRHDTGSLTSSSASAPKKGEWPSVPCGLCGINLKTSVGKATCAVPRTFWPVSSFRLLISLNLAPTQHIESYGSGENSGFEGDAGWRVFSGRRVPTARDYASTTD